MTTKLIGIKKFRENVTSLWKEARDKQIRYIVLFHSKPVFEVTPISEEEILMERLADDIAKAREQVKRGETLTHEEVLKKLGL